MCTGLGTEYKDEQGTVLACMEFSLVDESHRHGQ